MVKWTILGTNGPNHLGLWYMDYSQIELSLNALRHACAVDGQQARDGP